MTKRLLSVLAVSVFAVTMTVAAVDARISIGADLVERFEATETDGIAASSSLQDPAANLYVYGDVASNVDAYVELQVLQDIRNTSTGASQSDLEQVILREGYLSLDGLGPVSLKAGKFEVDFGNRHLERSDNADVQGNPLVGNDIMDPVAVQSGLELSGTAAGGNVGWALGITNGTFSTNFAEDGGYAFIPKLWGNLSPDLSAAFSYYTVDQSGSNPGGADNLFSVGTGEARSYDLAANPYINFISGPPFSGPSPASLDSIAGAAGGAGADISAWQVDFGWEGQMGEVNAWWGGVEDDNLSPAAEMNYYGVEGSFDLIPVAYAAARYSAAVDESSFAPDADQSDRLQVGLGYHLNENTLVKVEWVDQTNESPTSTWTASGANDDADGFLVELSAGF